MNTTVPPDDDLPCTELVQLITAYLDGALPPDVRTEVDRHLQGCAGCGTAIDQWRTVIALAGRLTEADVQTTDELTRDRLLSLCRGLRRR